MSQFLGICLNKANDLLLSWFEPHFLYGCFKKCIKLRISVTMLPSLVLKIKGEMSIEYCGLLHYNKEHLQTPWWHHVQCSFYCQSNLNWGMRYSTITSFMTWTSQSKCIPTWRCSSTNGIPTCWVPSGRRRKVIGLNYLLHLPSVPLSSSHPISGPSPDQIALLHPILGSWELPGSEMLLWN